MPIQIRRAAVKILIKDNSFGKLDEIREFASKNNLTAELEKTLSRFTKYSEEGYEVNLYADFAPHSLQFSLYRQGKLWVCGGMIFHGQHNGCGSGSAPSFSVSLSGNSKPHWELHT